MHEGACYVSFSGGSLKDRSDTRSVWMGTTYNSIRPATDCMIIRASSEVMRPSPPTYAAEMSTIISILLQVMPPTQSECSRNPRRHHPHPSVRPPPCPHTQATPRARPRQRSSFAKPIRVSSRWTYRVITINSAMLHFTHRYNAISTFYTTVTTLPCGVSGRHL